MSGRKARRAGNNLARGTARSYQAFLVQGREKANTMALRLKTLKPSIMVRIQAEDKRQKFSGIFDGLMAMLPEFTDAIMETFIIDQATRISSDVAKEPEKALGRLARLSEFCRLLLQKNVRSVKDLPVTKPLKVFFADFLAESMAGGEFTAIDAGGDGRPEKLAGQEIDFTDPHVYLREIEILDGACYEGKEASIKRLSDKLMAVIRLSLPLLDVAKVADKKLEASGKDGCQPRLASVIERTLDMLAGDQARLHTRRIMKVTRLVHALVTRIKDAEQQRETLQARQERPWLFMIAKEDRLPKERYDEQMDWLAAEITSAQRKLKHVVNTFKAAPECGDLVDGLEKLERHVDSNIIENLNEAILRIRATGTRGLIVSKQDLELARAAKINLEGILVTSDSPFPDLDKMYADYLQAKEKLYELTSSITSELARRTTEEKAIVENGILAAMLQVMKEYEENQRGRAGSGFLCMMAWIQGAALDLLHKLSDEIGKLSMLVSERGLEHEQVLGLLAAIGEKRLDDVVPSALEERVKTRTMPEPCIDTAARLLKYTPLSRDAYYSPAVTASRERITGLAANLKLLDAIFMILFEIGVNLEDLDTFLPRKFIAMEDARAPTEFASVLDKWLEDNVGRLFAAGGAGSHKLAGEKVGVIKAKLENLQDLLISIPEDVFEKVQPIPLDAAP
ncbi:MAG: hypothetical protein JW839_20345 [Candidatus Lokiarchaeota archaeon]|nr:hypothetical protein [Candidatus Lokiarchaeota archaeon]